MMWQAEKRCMNGYPSRFIRRYSDNRTPRRTEDDQRLPRTSLTLPYIGGLSEAVRRVLRPLDIKVAFRPLRTLYTLPTGLPQRPCTKGPACRGGVSDPLLRLPQSIHWSVWKDPETPVVWTPMGNSEWGCGCICFGRTHMVHWPPYGSIEGWSCWCPNLCEHTVSPGELAHPTPPTLNREKGTLPREYTALLD